MNPRLLLAPSCALLISGLLISRQRDSISKLELDNAGLRKQIAAHKNSLPNSEFRPKGTPTTDVGPVDWKQASAMITEALRALELSDRRGIKDLLRRIEAMESDQVLKSLEEISSLDLPEDSRVHLEMYLLNQLATQDPERVLTYCKERDLIEHRAIGGSAILAFERWIEKDFSRALAWFDQEITEGNFAIKSLDGTKSSRADYERCIFSALISTGPDAANRRLVSLPQAAKKMIFEDRANRRMKPEAYENFAKLVRHHLSEPEQAEIIIQPLAGMADRDGYAHFTEYLERVSATSEETAAAVELVAESKFFNVDRQTAVTPEEMDALRAWAVTLSPGTVDQVTSDAIITVAKGGDAGFENAVKLATHFRQSGNEEILIKFLESEPARENRDQSLILAGQISNPTRRVEIIQSLESEAP